MDEYPEEPLKEIDLMKYWIFWINKEKELKKH